MGYVFCYIFNYSYAYLFVGVIVVLWHALFFEFSHFDPFRILNYNIFDGIYCFKNSWKSGAFTNFTGSHVCCSWIICQQTVIQVEQWILAAWWMVYGWCDSLRGRHFGSSVDLGVFILIRRYVLRLLFSSS